MTIIDTPITRRRFVAGAATTGICTASGAALVPPIAEAAQIRRLRYAEASVK